MNMKLIYTLLFLVLWVNSLFAQKSKTVSAISNKIFISVANKTTTSSHSTSTPPYLEIKNYFFTDKDGNKKIDADESASINFDLCNTGSGTGHNLILYTKELNNTSGLEFSPSIKIPELKKGEVQHISIPVKGDADLMSGTASFNIVVDEPNGFDSDPLMVEIKTQSFKAPLVKVVDYQVSSQTSSTLERRKPFDLELLVQNLKQGTAHDVKVSVSCPANIFCLTANEKQNIEKLSPGEKKLLSYTFVANNEYRDSTINFNFDINEKYNLYAQDSSVILAMNQKVSTNKLIVKGENEENVDIAVASLTSDVDKNIPEISQKFSNKIALIIGNEDYNRSPNSEINVEYAKRDASVFREYAKKTMGVQKNNVYFYTNATSGVMNNEIDRVYELIKRMGSDTELIFYYAGHGFPDEKTHTPYLIPIDVNATNLGSAIPLKEVYSKFSRSGAKKITIILDACFSGGGRNQGLLAARSVRIKPKKEELQGNMVVFSASTDEQTALPYPSQKHGMFTYFLLKKLQETKGSVTFGDLDSYLRKNVGVTSLRVNGKVQDPVTSVSPSVQGQWEEKTF